MLGEWEKPWHGWQSETICVCCPVNAGREKICKEGMMWKRENTLCFPVFFLSGFWQVHCSRDLAFHLWQSELLAPANSSTLPLAHLFSLFLPLHYLFFNRQSFFYLVILWTFRNTKSRLFCMWLNLSACQFNSGLKICEISSMFCKFLYNLCHNIGRIWRRYMSPSFFL